MTEKQTDKLKVRTVIASGEVELWEDIPKFVYNHRCLSADIPCEHLDLPIGTKFEIVAVRSAEPKRELVPPDGAVWITSKMYPDRTRLIVDGMEIATVSATTIQVTWMVKPDEWIPATTLELAQRAAEEAKATAGEDSFRWEEVDPKKKPPDTYDWYEIHSWSHDHGPCPCQWSGVSSVSARVDFNYRAGLDRYYRITLHGYDGEERTELDRYEASGN